MSEPQAVLDGHSTDSLAHGWSPIASHYIQIELQPGENRDFIFVLGYAENEQNEKFDERVSGLVDERLITSLGEIDHHIINKVHAHALIDRFSTVEAVDEAFAELRAWWDEVLSKYSIQSSDERLSRMVNIWSQYQCMITFCFSRSASFFESGVGRGMGFRDSNQDLVGFVHQVPIRARQRIIDIASTQFPDGGCYHQYQPLTKRGNNDIGGGFNDDPMWLIFGTTAYIRETGDYSILDSEHGMVLNYPAYTTYHIELGEQSTYPAGYKENGGIFCHNNPWVIIAQTLAGKGNDAWALYKKISPAWIEDQDLHKVEPYVYCQMVAGKQAAKPGEGKNSWLTGTAAWNWLTISQYILGVHPTYEGLKIDPCIPADLKEYTVTRKWRDAEYVITVKNPNSKQHADNHWLSPFVNNPTNKSMPKSLQITKIGWFN